MYQTSEIMSSPSVTIDDFSETSPIMDSRTSTCGWFSVLTATIFLVISFGLLSGSYLNRDLLTGLNLTVYYFLKEGVTSISLFLLSFYPDF